MRRFVWALDADGLDWARDPVPPRLLERLVERQGLPLEAIRADRTLDPDVLARLGWRLTGTTLVSPSPAD